MFGAIFGAILGAFNFIVGGVVALAGLITSLFYGLAVGALHLVTSSDFISLSYTNPATNSFIAVGWELTRGLTNIIFVLALLAIGLGTALKMNDYQAKKALPLLIAVALLINFTPVILGVIVDASNIIMNYFLSSGFQGGNVLGNQMSNVLSLWNPAEGAFDPAAQGNKFMSLLVIVAFNIIAAFIFFIFAAIFLMRYVVIWLLVILSPIAFASYILPTTRGFFKKWWTQFLQWTFVGVTAGFYLYLANQLINLIISEKKITFASQGGEGLGLLNFILPWGVIIIFLILGLQSALSSSAQGASFAINAVKGAPKKFTGTRLGGKLTGGAASMTQKALRNIAPGLNQLKKVPLIGKGLDWTTRPLGWMAKGANRAVGPKLMEYAGSVSKINLPKDFENWGAPQQEAWARAKHLDKNDLLRVGSKMGKNMAYASKDFQDDVNGAATKSLISGNPAYQEEAKDIAKVSPNIMTEAVRIAMKTHGKKENSPEWIAARDEVKAEITETAKLIRSNLNLTDDNSIINVGLKLKYITQGDVTKNRAEALNTVNKKIMDEAATATYVRDFKAGDIGKIANTKALGVKMGFVLGNPNNFQRIVDEHGVGALKDAVEGAGGLNDATDTTDKLDKLFDVNQNAKAFFTNPALSQIDFSGRNKMLDPDDQSTRQIDAYERRRKVQKRLSTAPVILQNFNGLRVKANQLQQKIEEYKRKHGGTPAGIAAATAATVTLNKRLFMTEQEITRIYYQKINKNEKLRKEWQEIEKLRKPGKKKP